MTPKSSEESLHLAVVQLLKICAPRDVLWFHPANEAKRSPRTGAQLKRMGMLPGVADFTIILLGVMAEVYNERLPEDVRAELCAAAQAMEDALRVLAAQSLPGPHTGWQREAKVVG